MRYLNKTPGKGLYFKKTKKRTIELFTNVDWAGSITDHMSIFGYCTYLWGNLVTWHSKKQTVVAWSSAEAEFRAMAHGICKGMWLKQLLIELKVVSSDQINILCDNQAAISIGKNQVHRDCTKHVEINTL